MQEAVAGPLQQWESFYVIVGSSAAALTGLQFVVIALSSEAQKPATAATVAAFTTPTIVHFCLALLVSAVLSAPWHGLSGVAGVLGVCGAAGIVYTGIVTKRARMQIDYRLVIEDWLWYTAFPFVAYLALLSGAVALPRHAHEALFTIAAAALLLLFIGIHNAWDSVTYIALERMGPGRKKAEKQ
jgi:hypothetical protein